MSKLVSLKLGWAFALFAFLDIVCIGLGMGVPIFCILFGLPVGWYVATRFAVRPFDTKRVLTDMLVSAALTSAFTFVGMALLWGGSLVLLFDSKADVANFGMPLILFEPMASFVGWLALMIVISPFLQLLMTLFGSHLALLWHLRRTGEVRHDPAG